MRTLDANYLATHPEGDEKAVFTLTTNVPGRLDLKPNPDGTAPSISVKVVADTFLAALTILTQMHDDQDDMLLAWISEHLTPEQIKALDEMPDDDAPAPAFLKEAANDVHEEFLTFEVTAGATFEVNGEDVPMEAEITITAPSIASGMGAFRHLTTPKMLTSAAIGFSPETGDDEDWGDSNEVLVR